MKTPDDIKNGLKYAETNCLYVECCEDICPYNKDCDIGDPDRMTEIPRAIANDALAYIQQLEAQVPKWISVEERLPEEQELVLVHYTDDWMPVAFLLNGNWYNSGGERSWLSVTHWMPLPEPPKEEETNED